MRGVFVTGTGTGVGKSVVSAALAAALVARGDRVIAAKPLLSGLDEAPGVWPHDHDLLAGITGEAPDVIAPHRFGPAVSPHLAARWAGEAHTAQSLADEVRGRVADAGGRVDGDAAVGQDGGGAAGGRVDGGAEGRVDGGAAGGERDHVGRRGGAGSEPVVLVEGAGGLLVPLDDAGATMADLAAALGLPLLIAAHPGLGTINHVMLTVEAARSRSLPVLGIVLTPWPKAPSLIETDNAAYLAARTGLPVRRLARISAPEPALLAQAAAVARLPELLG